MTTAQKYDFRDQDPLWVRYAEWVGQGHDKFYEVRIDLADDGRFIMTKRWGPRPDVGKGQIQAEAFGSLPLAEQTANERMSSKLRKGYTATDRPLAANNQVELPDDDEDY